MFTRIRNHVWGPADKIIAAVVSLVLIAAVVVVVLRALPDECGGKGLRQVGPAQECVGVTEEAYVFDEELRGLIEAVARENARVRQEWESPEKGRHRVPFVRIALMMPYTADSSSAMSRELIRHSLAGAHTAQLLANQDSGLQYQLLLANDGKDLDHWEPVVEQLAGMTGGDTPLVGVIGFPNSTPQTQAAADALSKKRIPAIGATITSPDMSARYLFKASPSNEHFAQALERYLARKPAETGFLVWDGRKQDNYSANLRKVFRGYFGEKYGLRTRHAKFLGKMGEENLGIPQLFSSVAQQICLTEPDVIFYAGRDEDLPGLISELTDQPSCDHEKPIRVIKVGVGTDQALSSAPVLRNLREARITLVNAASVHRGWWPDGEEAAPRGFHDFFERLTELSEKLGQEHDQALLLPKALDDGYAVMFHDAFLVAASATDQVYDDAQDVEKSGETWVPSPDDVYHTITGMSILTTEEGADCTNCVRGASGTFGYDTEPSTDHWPICKPVPVEEYPEPWPVGDDASTAGGEGERSAYRAHQDLYDGKCP